ncbi:hypothetical protein [Sulfitobacter sp.]|uniref:hypothetical protein n=1 Tax=Sulfitobacter sp. TaxID=1903071 RepID=UPI003001A509
MIPRTPRSGWTVKQSIAAAGVLLAVVFSLGVAFSPPRTPKVAVIGDRAAEVRAVLGSNQGKEATVTFVLLERWESLRHLPDIAELCWDVCHDRAASQITLTQMRFGATRKVVVFYLPAFGENLDCLVTRARHELIALRAQIPACNIKASRLPVWILPLGLGRIS